MTPTVGRIVHYQSYGTPGGEFLPEPRAAVVSEVNADPNPGELVGLVVLNPTGLFFNRNVKHAENDIPTPGCWNWPPKV